MVAVHMKVTTLALHYMYYFILTHQGSMTPHEGQDQSQKEALAYTSATISI
jgi:hypothetical protein